MRRIELTEGEHKRLVKYLTERLEYADERCGSAAKGEE